MERKWGGGALDLEGSRVLTNVLKGLKLIFPF